MKTRPIPYRPRHDIAMNCIATPRGGKWRCCNVHGIEVYRSVTLGPGWNFQKKLDRHFDRQTDKQTDEQADKQNVFKDLGIVKNTNETTIKILLK